MKLRLYRMRLASSHFGKGLLENATATMSVERLFSALFNEAVLHGLHQDFLSLAQSDDFQLSDVFFYAGGELFLPKPIGYPKLEVEVTEHSRDDAKKVKRIQAIPASRFADFCRGQVKDLSSLVSKQKALYRQDVGTRVSRYDEQGDPYRVATTHYDHGVELAFIASDQPLLQTLLESLQYTGIGGKRSAGLGRFDLSVEDLSPQLSAQVTVSADGPVMLLTSAIAQEDDLANAVAQGQYLVVKASGYAFSSQVKDSYRKQDIFKFKAGSTFGQTFKGALVDVAPEDFPHPVWHYAKPLFLKLEV